MPPPRTSLTQTGSPPVTGYQAFCRKWKDGCGSSMCGRANKIVQARGQLPCDVLFVGEAPGASEDTLGDPFVGPAGKLLDRIVTKAVRSIDVPLRIGFMNLVGCMPRTEKTGGKADELEWEQVEQCTPRTVELIRLASPRLIVMVGKNSQDFLKPGFKHTLPHGVDAATVGIVHPAYILRSPIASQGLLEQRCVVDIIQSLEEL